MRERPICSYGRAVKRGSRQEISSDLIHDIINVIVQARRTKQVVSTQFVACDDLPLLTAHHTDGTYSYASSSTIGIVKLFDASSDLQVSLIIRQRPNINYFEAHARQRVNECFACALSHVACDDANTNQI